MQYVRSTTLPIKIRCLKMKTQITKQFLFYDYEGYLHANSFKISVYSATSIFFQRHILNNKHGNKNYD